MLEGFIPVIPWKALSLLFLPSPQAGINGKEEHENAKAILLEMGEFFQIQVGGGSTPLGGCQVLAVALRCFCCRTGRLPGLLRGPSSDREGWHRHPGQQVQLAGGGVSAPGHAGAEADPGGKGRDHTPGRGDVVPECTPGVQVLGCYLAGRRWVSTTGGQTENKAPAPS